MSVTLETQGLWVNYKCNSFTSMHSLQQRKSHTTSSFIWSQRAILWDERSGNVFLRNECCMFHSSIYLSIYLFINSLYSVDKDTCVSRSWLYWPIHVIIIFRQEADKLFVCFLLKQRLFNRKSSCSINSSVRLIG